MVERRTANGVEEICQLTGYSCPKAARRWLKRLGIFWNARNLVVDKALYHERVRKYNQGLLRVPAPKAR